MGRASSAGARSARNRRLRCTNKQSGGRVMQLQGVGAIVTGGASGLGAATAKELAKAGAKDAIFDMNQDLAAQTAKELDGDASKCTVAEAKGGEAAAQEAHARAGPVQGRGTCPGAG